MRKKPSKAKERRRQGGRKSSGLSSAATISPKSPFAHVVEGYERALFLDSFLEAGRVPSVTDVEIAVCFADLRGFTKYVHALQANWQDTRVHEFLSAYFQIFPKAVGPEGIVAQVGFCDPVLRDFKGQGAQVRLKGLENPVDIWASSTVALDL